MSFKIMRDLTGPAIKRRILKDDKMIEDWNDEENLTGNNRDRLGDKEARFQVLLVQVLNSLGYKVLVESYFPKKVRSKGVKSCDLYVYKSRYECWIEVKKIKLDSGGKVLIEEFLLDIGKMLRWKGAKDKAIFWLAFYTDKQQNFEYVFDDKDRHNDDLAKLISKDQLKSIFRAKKKGPHPSPRKRIKSILVKLEILGTGKAIKLIDSWVKSQGGDSQVLPISPRKGEIKKHLVKYGLYCGAIN